MTSDRSIGLGEVAAVSDGVGVVGSEDPFVLCHGLLQHQDGLTPTARSPVSAGEVAQAGKDEWVVESEERSAVGQVLLMHPNGVSMATHPIVRGCEVITSLKG